MAPVTFPPLVTGALAFWLRLLLAHPESTNTSQLHTSNDRDFAAVCFDNGHNAYTFPNGGISISTLPNQRDDKLNIKSVLNCVRRRGLVLIAAHRGKSAAIDAEHSRTALQHLLALSRPLLEIDLSSTFDGVDVLHHDELLDRTTEGTGPVAHRNWEEVKALRLRGPNGTIVSDTVMSFDGFLNLVDGRALLMIDLKAPSSVNNIVNALHARGLLQTSMLIVYDTEQYKKLRALSSDLLIAVGANAKTDLDTLSAISAYTAVGLAGDLKTINDRLGSLNGIKQYFSAGVYEGEENVEERDQVQVSGFARQAIENNIQILVSDDPLLTSGKLASMVWSDIDFESTGSC